MANLYQSPSPSPEDYPEGTFKEISWDSYYARQVAGEVEIRFLIEETLRELESLKNVKDIDLTSLRLLHEVPEKDDVVRSLALLLLSTDDEYLSPEAKQLHNPHLKNNALIGLYLAIERNGLECQAAQRLGHLIERHSKFFSWEPYERDLSGQVGGSRLELDE